MRKHATDVMETVNSTDMEYGNTKYLGVIRGLWEESFGKFKVFNILYIPNHKHK